MKILTPIFYIFISIFLLSFDRKIYAEVNKFDERDSVAMITISSGEFLMGSKSGEGRSDERPQNKIYLDTYEIDAHEVSNKRYLNFIQKTDREEPPNPYGENSLSAVEGVSEAPVVQVTWYDAVDYLSLIHI